MKLNEKKYLEHEINQLSGNQVELENDNSLASSLRNLLFSLELISFSTEDR